MNVSWLKKAYDFYLRYKKFFVAAGAGLVVLVAAIQDGKISAAEWWQIGSAILGALGVAVVANKPKS